MREVITNRVLGLFEDWTKSDADKYNGFFRKFGNYLKLGLTMDFASKDRIVELLRLETSKTESGMYTSLKDYVSAMGEDQKEIYYITGDSRAVVEKNPNLEYFRKNAVEVLFLTDPVDLFTVTSLPDYDGKPLVSIEKADIELSDNAVDTEESEALKGKEAKDVLTRFKEILGDRVEAVIESKRLVDSVATLVVGDQGMDAQMERMMKMMDQNFSSAKKILEVNMKHPLVKNLAVIIERNHEDPVFTDSVEQIYDAALLVEDNLKNPMDFVRRAMDFMEKATRS
jgi:molecular chaperone HtpG